MKINIDFVQRLRNGRHELRDLQQTQRQRQVPQFRVCALDFSAALALAIARDFTAKRQHCVEITVISVGRGAWHTARDGL